MGAIQTELFEPEQSEPPVVMVYFHPSARLKSVPDAHAEKAGSIGGMVGARLERMGLKMVLGDYDALPNNPRTPNDSTSNDLGPARARNPRTPDHQPRRKA